MNENVQTICLNCCFAQYKDDNQIGCDLDIPQRFKEKGYEVEEVQSEDGRGFYCIHGKVCVFHRYPVWTKCHKQEDLVQAVRREVSLKADVVLVAFKGQGLDAVTATVDSLKQQELLPANVVFINNNQDIKPSQFLKWLKDSNLPFKWRFEQVIDEELSVERAFDLGVGKCKSIFYSTFQAGFIVPVDYFSSIDKALYDDLEAFVLLKPVDEVNGAFVLRQFHIQAGGNNTDKLVNKAERITEKQSCQYLLKEIAQIVPSINQPSQS